MWRILWHMDFYLSGFIIFPFQDCMVNTEQKQHCLLHSNTIIHNSKCQDSSRYHAFPALCLTLSLPLLTLSTAFKSSAFRFFSQHALPSPPVLLCCKGRIETKLRKYERLLITMKTERFVVWFLVFGLVFFSKMQIIHLLFKSI